MRQAELYISAVEVHGTALYFLRLPAEDGAQLPPAASCGPQLGLRTLSATACMRVSTKRKMISTLKPTKEGKSTERQRHALQPNRLVGGPNHAHQPAQGRAQQHA